MLKYALPQSYSALVHTRGGFNKGWAYSVKRIQIWEEMQKVGREAQIHDAIIEKKDGHRAQISSIGRKLLYEIHPRN
jgi:hypothetical protein